MTHAVMSYIRANPPTLGHEKLYKKMVEVVAALPAPRESAPFLYVSPKQDNKKNPLDHMTRVQLLRDSGIYASIRRYTDFFQAVRSFNGHIEYLHVVVGEDRYIEMEKKLNFYNGVEYQFDTITIHSSGDRDPDSDGVSNISGTKMREYVRLGQTANFAAGLPEKLQHRAEEIERMVRDGLGLSRIAGGKTS